MQWKLRRWPPKIFTEVYYIGTLKAEGVTTAEGKMMKKASKKMEELLASHEIDGSGNDVSSQRIDGWTCCDSGEGKRDVYCQYNRNFQFRPYRMNDQNTIYGIIAAKACGKEHPDCRNSECGWRCWRLH